MSSKLEENENVRESAGPKLTSAQKKQRGTIIICSAAFVMLAVLIAAFIILKEELANRMAAQREEAEIEAVLDVGTIYTNVYINDINVGGLTKEQALEILESQVSSNLADLTITFRYDSFGYSREFTFEDLGVKYDFESSVNEAYEFGRENPELKQRYAEVMENKDRGKYLDTNWLYDNAQTEECVQLICDDLDKDPVNSQYLYQDGTITITDSYPGYKVDKERTAEMAEELLPIGRDADVMIALDQIAPEYTREDFEFTSSTIGTYSSSFTTGDEARVTNLSVAASKLNGQTIMPGETFSTNDCFSPYDEASGYKYAGAYVNGELTEDIGGGVCQVSSALYNAALKAELEITERYNHSKKVGYMDYAYDATLAGDVKDLKITNNTGYPLIIKAALENNAVVVTIDGYETHDSGRTLEFYNEKTGSTDSTVTYELYKKVYENGELVDTVKINKSTYNTK